VPFVGLVASEEEMRLVVALDGRTMGADEIAQLMGWDKDEASARLREATSRIILQRTGASAPPPAGTHTPTADGIVQRTGAATSDQYAASTFYYRMGPLARYERWNEVPADVRQEVVDWELAEWMKLWVPLMKEIDANPDAYRRLPQHDFLLLTETLEMVDAADAWAVSPCNCRATIQACERPVLSCIHLNEVAKRATASGRAQLLTREECRDLVVQMDRHGLTHTGDYRWRESASSVGFCNCCTCDCFPLRGALAFGLRTRFPRMHWIATVDASKCEDCGSCVRRCSFGAHFFDGSTVTVRGHERKGVSFDPDKCWGCGLCETGCQQGAITMVPVETGLTRHVFASDAAREYFATHVSA
jgi:NAD-dependent dihydropyrimidine dehydrogenase PreA subunit